MIFKGNNNVKSIILVGLWNFLEFNWLESRVEHNIGWTKWVNLMLKNKLDPTQNIHVIHGVVTCLLTNVITQYQTITSKTLVTHLDTEINNLIWCNIDYVSEVVCTVKRKFTCIKSLTITTVYLFDTLSSSNVSYNFLFNFNLGSRLKFSSLLIY